MKWPTHTDYQDAIQNPQTCFAEPDLKTGTIVSDMLGLPRVMSGNFASVYELNTPAGHWAVRCFVRQVAGQQGRYSRLSQYLTGIKLDSLVKFEYFLKGILVHGDWYPVVQMQWVSGKQLNTFIEEHLQDPETLRQLAARWRVMVNQLRASKLAHGDLQHGNVMVTPEGELRLVDYDGMYCPAFGRGRSPELGHANFQHPLRTPDYYEEGLDNFSALVVYVSLLALAREPELWAKFNMGDNLVLTSADFRNTQHSEPFQRLKTSPDKQVQDLAALLQQCCIAPVALTPWFEDALVAVEQGTTGTLVTALGAQMQSAAAAAPTPAWIEAKSGPTGDAAARSGSRAATRPSPPPAGVMPDAVPSAGKGKLQIILAAVALLAVGGLGVWLFPKGKQGSPARPVVSTPADPATTSSEPPTTSAGTPTRSGTVPTPATTTKSTALRSLAATAGSVGWTAFSTDGKLLGAGYQDGTINVWDPSAGQIKKGIPGQGDGVHWAFFLPDGKTLVSVSADNTVRYHDLISGQVTRTVEDYTKNLWAVALAPDGQALAVGATDRKIVRLLDAKTGAIKRMFSQHPSWVRSVDFSPDSRLIAVACHDDTVKIWTVASGEGGQTFSVPGNTAEYVGFSPDGKLLATGGQGRTLKVWDVQTGKIKQTFIGHDGDVKCYAFSPSGRVVASGGEDKVVRVWDIASGQLKQAFTGHTDGVNAVAFSPDGRILASASGDQTVKLWDASKLGL